VRKIEFARVRLVSQRRTEVETAFLEELKRGANIRYQVPAPELPRYPVDADDNPAAGPKNAKVTIIEFSDYQCPYCGRATKMLDRIKALYPEVFKCVACNTCTKSCPMDIEVMDYMAAAMRGDVARLAELSFDCVMCGLCTSRCPAEICQYNIAILGRRLYGKSIAPKAEHLASMVKDIEKANMNRCSGG
jgi:ferredoxin